MKLLILLAMAAACFAQTIPTPNPGDPLHLPASGGSVPSGSNGDLPMKSGSSFVASPINCVGTACATAGTFSVGTSVAVNGTANTVTVAGASTGNPVTITATGTDASVPIVLNSKAAWNSAAGGVFVNNATIPANYTSYHTTVGSPPAPLDFVISQQAAGYYSGLNMPNVGDGAIANSGSTLGYSYIEFAKYGGTVASPTAVPDNWILGELAFVAYNAVAGIGLVTPLLIEVQTQGGRKGQLNWVFDSSNRADPDFTFSTTKAQMRTPLFALGTNATLHALTSGLQIRNTNATSNFNMVRDGASNYAYYGVTPEVTVDSTHVHYGQGLYASDYNLTLWKFNGSANTILQRQYISGGLYVGSSPSDPGAGIIQTQGYKSSDGSAGVTVTTCTSFKNGLCVAGT